VISIDGSDGCRSSRGSRCDYPASHLVCLRFDRSALRVGLCIRDGGYILGAVRRAIGRAVQFATPIGGIVRGWCDLCLEIAVAFLMPRAEEVGQSPFLLVFLLSQVFVAGWTHGWNLVQN
jgi:hypothetical protein